MRLLPALAVLCLSPAAALAAAGQDEAVGMTQRMMFLAMQLGLIMLSAKVGGQLFERIAMPAVLGELAVGMVIGPYALGQIGMPGFPHGLFPLAPGFPVSPELFGLSSVAAVVLLFTVGLETDLRLLRRYSLVAGAVGLGGVVGSFLFGDLTAMLFSPLLFGRQLGAMAPPCLFLGAVSTATSVAITARILSERRKTDSPEAVTIVAGAVIDDVLGIIVFALIAGMVSASKATGTVDWGHIGAIAAKAVGVWLAATALGLLASRKISALLKLFREPSAIALMSLGLCLILSALFEEAGLAMIIGAYVMGLSLSKTDISHVIRERLRPIYLFLTPVFFCVMGMLIDFRAIASWPALIFGLLYTLGAVAGKVLGCGLPALMLNFNVRGAARIGVGMIPRGEVALIIAGVGLATGVLTAGPFAAAIIMTVATTVLAPPILVLSFKSPREGVRRPAAAKDGGAESIRYDLPSAEMADFLVTKLSATFESDGFFVHTLSQEPPLYELRKDDIIIDFQRVGAALAFTCPRRDAPLVWAAVLEAAASVEQALKGLSRPLDTEAIREKIQPQDLPAQNFVGLGQYLTPALIKPDLAGATGAEIIDELIGLLSSNALLKDAGQARDAVVARERNMPTILMYGVAVPHARTDAVDRLVCAVGIKKEGVSFGPTDGARASIFVLTLSPSDKPAPHLQFMAAVSQVLTESTCARLQTCKTAREAYAVLTTTPTS